MQNLSKVLLGAALIGTSVSYSQSANVGDTQNVAIPANFQTAMFVKEKRLPNADRVGSPYVIESPQMGTIYASGLGELRGYKLNINLETQFIEIYTENDVKGLNLNTVDSLLIETETGEFNKYVNMQNQYPDLGICMFNGKYGNTLLLVEKKMRIKEPQYNLATNTGQQHETVLITDNPKVVIDNTIYDFPLNKDEWEQLAGTDYKAIRDYYKALGMDMKNFDHLKLYLQSTKEKALD